MIKAVHYFSSCWAANFWGGFNEKSVPNDFRQIVSDGFNTVILLLPWRGFQLDIEKEEYNTIYIERLKFLLQQAEVYDLQVLIRVSYPHYFCPSSIGSPLRRIEQVLRDHSALEMWSKFLSMIDGVVSKYSSYKYSFISWEDYWHVLRGFQSREKHRRLKISKDLGYSGFVMESLGLDSYNDYACPGEDIYKHGDEIEIPEEKSPRHKYYLDFINFKINEMLDYARAYISPCVMEVRIDKDFFFDNKGERHWYSNDLQMDSQLPRLTYWAPFVGAENAGEILTADQSYAFLEYYLQGITNFGDNTRHIINQFNFIDETPEFKGVHAEIKEGQLHTFMHKAAPLLEKYSQGYGLWAYKDYRQNILTNPEFALNERGWNSFGSKISFIPSKGALIKKNGKISQGFTFFDRGVWGDWLVNSQKLFFSIEIGKQSWFRRKMANSLSVSFSGEKAVSITIKDDRCYGFLDISEIVDPYQEFEFEITCEKGSVLISQVALFLYEFKNHIYGPRGNPGRYRDMVVKFNSDLG